MTHNDVHLAHCEARAVEALTEWRCDHPGQPFTVEQVVADITEDQRSVFVLIHSCEGGHVHIRAVFDEVEFDYETFSRRDWSKAIRNALEKAPTAE